MFCDIIYLVPILDWTIYQFGWTVDSVHGFRGGYDFIAKISSGQNQGGRKTVYVLDFFERHQGNRVEVNLYLIF